MIMFTAKMAAYKNLAKLNIYKDLLSLNFSQKTSTNIYLTNIMYIYFMQKKNKNELT